MKSTLSRTLVVGVLGLGPVAAQAEECRSGFVIQGGRMICAEEGLSWASPRDTGSRPVSRPRVTLVAGKSEEACRSGYAGSVGRSCPEGESVSVLHPSTGSIWFRLARLLGF